MHHFRGERCSATGNGGCTARPVRVPYIVAVTSPIAIQGSDPTAVVGRRIAAYIIDVLLMLLVMVPLGVWSFSENSQVAPAGTVSCSSDSGRGSTARLEIDSAYCFEWGDEVRYLVGDDANDFTFLIYGSGLTSQVLNLIVLQGLTGASVGKFVMGLRVVRMETGRRAGFGWIVLRWLLLIVDAFCCILPGIVLVASTKGHRRLGDMAAGTLVVRRDAVGRGPIPVPGLNVAPPSGGWGSPQPGWGAPPAPGGWEQPSSGGWEQPRPGGWGDTPTTPPTDPPGAASGSTPPAPPTGPSTEGPTWDEARGAYIQFDRARGEWMQWHESESEWRPISR